MGTESLGDFQQLVMLAVLRLDEEAYAGRIRQEIQEVAGRAVSISAIYVTLVRMEDKELVRSFDGETPATGGRPRRCFETTPAGRELLRSTREAAARMATGVEI